MICYKDKTFCASDCTNKSCHRHKSQLPPIPPLPVSFANFKETCEDYQAPEGKEDE